MITKPKRLRPTTIIPTTLYVERAADRQLRSIIEDMGRPGYVLVARQMGKTNLLINMKRERTSDIVLYLDLSNRFDSVRPWFRHVIDSLIESYPDLFRSASATIYQQRQNENLQPNVEYDRHLRLLLRSTERKFVIVLDEIDSLVNAPYSDTILAQIRSMYFSRVNYSEYERLTYVLSGVAEPNDLIKDRNISPFNIGEKIYLEDFSRAEFDQFLSKAGFIIPSEAADTIFYWAGGNPRMTWDICSELEECFLNGDVLTKEIIDSAVEKLYLNEFDRAPVDHIRSLVESDVQIREAIISIRYRNYDLLDDKTKSRLYLAGIIRSASTGTVDIKNRIIDEALSDRWLSQISNTRTSLLKLASQSFKEGRYKESIIQFEAIFTDSTFAEMIPAGTRYEFALSYFHTGNMTRAAQELENCFSGTDDPANLQSLNYYLGLARSTQGNFVLAKEFLEKAANGPDRSIQITAKIALLQTQLSIDPMLHGKKVIESGYELIKELHKPEDTGDESDAEFLVATIINIAIAYATQGDYLSATKEYEHALLYAQPKWQNTIFLRLYDVQENAIAQKEFALKAAQVIVGDQLNFSGKNDSSLQLNETRLLQTLFRLNKHGLNKEFDDLVRYTTGKIYENKLSPAEAILNLYELIGSEEKQAAYVEILGSAFIDYSDADTSPSLKLKLLRRLSVYSDPTKLDFWRRKYIDVLTFSATLGSIEEDDFGALTAVAFTLLRTNAHQELEKLLTLSKSFESSRTGKTSPWSILIAYCEMEYQLSIGKKRPAGDVAARIVALMDKAEVGNLDEEAKNMLPEIRTRALNLLPRKPMKRDPSSSFGRNQWVKVKYADDTIVERKFKQVETDLREGHCTLAF